MTLSEAVKPQFTSDWWEYLGKEFEEQYMVDSAEKIKTARKKISVYPAPGQVFRAFGTTTLNEVKVVWISQDPYHSISSCGVAQATGLAMDCGAYISPTMKQLQFAYAEEFGHLTPEMRQGHLFKWASQGVLLLNVSLTVEERRPDSHSRLWERFTAKVMTAIVEHAKPSVFVFLGRKAQRYSNWVRAPHVQMYREHPQAPNYDNPPRDWDHMKIYTTINHDLKALGREPIDW